MLDEDVKRVKKISGGVKDLDFVPTSIMHV